MRRFALAVILAAGTAMVYFRPAALLGVARDVVLWHRGVREGDVRVGPHRIHYLTMGEGPPLVLVHGLAMRAKDWSPVLQDLGRGRRVYALDLLGSGDSDQPTDAEYSVRQQTEIVRGFIDALSLQQPDVLGISMGGWIALRYAAENPSRVRRLVLVSSAGFDFPTDIREGTFAPRDVAGLRAIMALQTDHPANVPDFMARDFVRQLREQDMVVRRATNSLLSGRDFMDGRVATVRMPVLLIAGTADRIVPYNVSERMKEELPHATLVPLEGCGHIAIVECRDRAMPAIRGFLE